MAKIYTLIAVARTDISGKDFVVYFPPMRTAGLSSRFGKKWLFVGWLVAFYTCWLLLVILGQHWETVKAHWPIALAMAAGSYFAGATPMGGGTVGFPVLVLFFGLPGSLGRNFGLAVQSIGMVSASIYILCAHLKLDWKLLRPALAGALIGTPLGAVAIAPFIPDMFVKLAFAIVWASFGIMHLLKMRELVAANGESTRWQAWDTPIGLSIGIVGGVVASMTGVGIDMIIYAILVLLFKADLRIAIPTSVVLMAFTSLVGIASNIVLSKFNDTLYPMPPEVFANWLAAAPIVALGAPFGAVVVNLIPRIPTLILVSVLCVGQFIWTIVNQRVTGLPLLVALLAVLAMNVVFHMLYKWGQGLHVLSNRPLEEEACNDQQPVDAPTAPATAE